MESFNRAAMLRNPSGLVVRAMFRKPTLLTIMVALLAISPLCRAQIQATSLGSAIELARADMSSQRNEIVTATMQLSDKDAVAFWPIYRKYEYERSLLDEQGGRRKGVRGEVLDYHRRRCQVDDRPNVGLRLSRQRTEKKVCQGVKQGSAGELRWRSSFSWTIASTC